MSLGILLGLLAAAEYGVAAVLVRAALQHVSATLGTMISITTSFLVTSIVTLLVAPQALFTLSLSAALWFAFIGILQFPMGRFFNYQSVARIGVGKAAPLIATSPLFAVAIAVLFTGEQLTVPLLLGALSIFAGIYLVVTGGG